MNSPRRASTREIPALLLAAWDTNAVSTLACMVMLPAMIITDSFFQTPMALPLANRLGISVLAWAAMTTVLVTANALILRHLPSGWLRRGVVLVTYAASGAARVLAVSALVNMQLNGESVALAAGTAAPVRVVSTVVWLSALAVLVTVLRRSAASAANLKAELERLEATRAATAAELERTAAELASVRRLVASAIARTHRTLRAARTREDLTQVADQLANTVEQLVRPASHQLVADAATPLAGPAGQQARLTWWQNTLGIVTVWPTAAPFQTAAVALLTVPIALAAILFHAWSWPALLGIALLGAQLLLLRLLERIPPPPTRHPQPTGPDGPRPGWLPGTPGGWPGRQHARAIAGRPIPGRDGPAPVHRRHHDWRWRRPHRPTSERRTRHPERP